MSLAHAILGFLGRGPMTGYELKTRWLDGPASHFWTADKAQVYRTLDRLEREDVVTSDIVEQRGRPDRIVYSITPLGRETMLDWLVEPHRSPPVRDPLLMQLFFASDLSDEDVLEILIAARTTHQQRLDSLRERKGEESSHIPPSPERERDAALSGMTLDGSIATARANVDWLDDCIEKVERGLPGRPRRGVRQYSKR